MPDDLKPFLWLLKLGALINLYFLLDTFALEAGDPFVVVPAQILFAVSAYRCVFPNRYKDNVVLHDTVLSSTLVTRVLATFVEVAWIFQFAYVLKLQNVEGVAWIDAAAWLMVLQVSVSQLCVWGAILGGRLSLYAYEELGWGILFAALTAGSVYLLATTEPSGGGRTVLQLNLLFAVFYLPWQAIHVRALWVDAQGRSEAEPRTERAMAGGLAERVRRSLHERTPATDAASWGGAVGLTWMTAYWATVIPAWVYVVVRLAGGAARGS